MHRYDVEAYVLTLFVVAAGGLIGIPPISSSATLSEESGEAPDNYTTSTIITSHRSIGQNDSGTTNIILNSNTDPARDNNTLGGIRDPLNVREHISDLIASVTNNTMVEGVGVTDMRLSGNIASAHFNLSNGQVEQTFFGNWSLQVRRINNASFEADFNGSDGVHYTIYNFTMNSFQLVNEHVVLGGTVDVSEVNQNQSWQNVAVSILVVNGRNLSITFGEPELDEIFSRQPIYGIATE